MKRKNLVKVDFCARTSANVHGINVCKVCCLVDYFFIKNRPYIHSKVVVDKFRDG